MSKKSLKLKFIVFDYLSAVVAWILFFFARKFYVEHEYFDDVNSVFTDVNFFRGIIFIPVFWLLLYWCFGEYRNIYFKSRLKNLGQTIVECALGVILLFFAFLLDDYVGTYKNYYFTFTVLFILHFMLTYIPRLLLTSRIVYEVHKDKIGFPSLMIVSDGKRAEGIFSEIKNQTISSGYLFKGFISLKGDKYPELEKLMPCLGDMKDLYSVFYKQSIENIIIVLDNNDGNELYDIVSRIPKTNIFIPSERKDFITGNIKYNAIFSVPLVRISQNIMQPWEVSVKRAFDIIVSIFAMIILIPVYLVTAVIIKITSPGPVLYAQQRIGKNGKPFMMYKFRSMCVDAEKNGPMLSKGDTDDRITKFGYFMRKVRLDETPQFFHVLRGEMSMVGPRPERQFFIDQIVKEAPEYNLLQQIQPGMTSWGQVKYGYADTVDQMVERLKYDLLYLQNMSLYTDIKILLYTALIILQGRGK